MQNGGSAGSAAYKRPRVPRVRKTDPTTNPAHYSVRDRNLQMALSAIQARDLRQIILGSTAQFADAPWDILLHLYVATARGEGVIMGEAERLARVPKTTAIRSLLHLESIGVVARRIDPADRRRTLIYLTDQQMAAMDAYFDATRALLTPGEDYSC